MAIGEIAAAAVGSVATAPAAGTRPPRPQAPLPGNATQAGAAAQEAPQHENVRQAVRQANAHAAALKRDLQFSVDDSTGQTVIRVIDAQTHEVIRQIPPDEMLALARTLLQMNDLTLLNAVA